MNKNNPILNDEGECQGYTQDADRIKEAVVEYERLRRNKQSRDRYHERSE